MCTAWRAYMNIKHSNLSLNEDRYLHNYPLEAENHKIYADYPLTYTHWLIPTCCHDLPSYLFLTQQVLLWSFKPPEVLRRVGCWIFTDVSKKALLEQTRKKKNPSRTAWRTRCLPVDMVSNPRRQQREPKFSHRLNCQVKEKKEPTRCS
jgi:hypothetical protein